MAGRFHGHSFNRSGEGSTDTSTCGSRSRRRPPSVATFSVTRRVPTASACRRRRSALPAGGSGSGPCPRARRRPRRNVTLKMSRYWRPERKMSRDTLYRSRRERGMSDLQCVRVHRGLLLGEGLRLDLPQAAGERERERGDVEAHGLHRGRDGRRGERPPRDDLPAADLDRGAPGHLLAKRRIEDRTPGDEGDELGAAFERVDEGAEHEGELLGGMAGFAHRACARRRVGRVSRPVLPGRAGRSRCG